MYKKQPKRRKTIKKVDTEKTERKMEAIMTGSVQINECTVQKNRKSPQDALKKGFKAETDRQKPVKDGAGEKTGTRFA